MEKRTCKVTQKARETGTCKNTKTQMDTVTHTRTEPQYTGAAVRLMGMCEVTGNDQQDRIRSFRTAFVLLSAPPVDGQWSIGRPLGGHPKDSLSLTRWTMRDRVIGIRQLSVKPILALFERLLSTSLCSSMDLYLCMSVWIFVSQLSWFSIYWSTFNYCFPKSGYWPGSARIPTHILMHMQTNVLMNNIQTRNVIMLGLHQDCTKALHFRY